MYSSIYNWLKYSFLILLLLVIFRPEALAQDYTSSNFILSDPTVTIEGGYATSSSFQLFNSLGQTISGQNTSTNFIQRVGFLYFPVATSPVVTSTSGNGEVELSWTASTATLASITRYRVGVSTTSGSGYTYTNVGNVLSYTVSSLTNGTTYYFLVKADTGTLTLASSSEVSATPASSSGLGASSRQGGAGAAVPLASFSGLSYPNSQVFLLKDGVLSSVTTAANSGSFRFDVSGITVGSYIFSIYGQGSAGRNSPLLNFTVILVAGKTAYVSGILIPPTLVLDKEEVKRGGILNISGESIRNSKVFISITADNGKEFQAQTASGQNGSYSYAYDSSFLEPGGYTVSATTETNGISTRFSRGVNFSVGTRDVPVASLDPKITDHPSDLNSDGRVNLIDFSILIYWFDKANPPSRVDFSFDGRVDIFDFSILAYYWTG